MSAHRSIPPTLRDRLLSNSTDPVQSSILRDSAKGWGKSPSNSNSGTTPLRIAKREGKPPFPLVARRSSSSYKHVRNSNLVSKSPFKTQAATPSRPSTFTSSSDISSAQQGTRRVSGEKRPRPDSMHEQAENERPLTSKRERCQSKEQPPPVSPKAAFTSTPPPPPAPPSPPSSAPPSRPVTPSRSSLVSKRLHGPRAVDRPLLDGRRQRRKTVTFDERCDVLEFDRDDDDDGNPFFSSEEDDYGEPDQHEDIEAPQPQIDDKTLGDDDAEQPEPRTRISREDVHIRLMRKRSMESPLGSPAPGSPAPPMEQPVAEKVDGRTIDGQGIVAPGVDELDRDDERRDMVSAMDISAELATIQAVEKWTMNATAVTGDQQEDVIEGGEEDAMIDDALSAAADGTSPPAEPIQPQPMPARPQSSFGMLETSCDCSGSLGIGLRDSMGSIQLGEMRSALDRLMDDVKGSCGSSTKKTNARSATRVELVTEGIEAGQISANTSSNIGDESVQTETDMDISTSDFRNAPIVQPATAAPPPIQRAATDSIVYTAPSFRSPVDEDPLPVSPTKDAIKARERLVLEKRRQARRRDQEESVDYYTPPRSTSMPPSSGRPSRRRSRSTGDAAALTKSELLLDIGISDTEEELLADSISKELRRRDPEQGKGKYRIREHDAIFASADAEQVSQTSFAGDVNGGKVWKAVRRPSDMNEYAKQIREYQSQEKPGKAHGKVFVRVLGVRGLKVPTPQQATALSCTLNNGIHYVTTPETRLSSNARIDQEFELIEHNKLEFTLTLKVRRDPHIVAQFKALAPPPPPPLPAPQPAPPPPKPKGGVFSFLSSSPKKPPARGTPPPPVPAPPPPHRLPDNLARYLKQDGTLARAFISFKDIAAQCDVCLLEVRYPLIGQRSDASGGATTMELGEIVLQMFRLPSLPGVLSSQLPLSLDECLRGLRHVAWHKVTYFEGTLTQNGGDCMSWRRRMFRVTGANLIAFNDVTKKATATINLKKALAVEDTQDARSSALDPDGRHRDDYDSLIAVERSFRLVFPSEQEILFFADSYEEKAKWLEVLRALVGHIPPNPLWAELVWQRQQEMAAQLQPSSSAS